MANWYVNHNNVETGPVSATELKSLVSEGKVGANTKVRREDMPNWVLAQNVKGLLPLRKPSNDKDVGNHAPEDSDSEVAPSHHTAASRLVAGMKTATLIATTTTA